MLVDRASMEAAQSWFKNDPNSTTADYVKSLCEQASACASSEKDEAASKEITSLFPRDNRRIGFGTAGLRAAMKPGPLCMNDLTVIQAAQGLAKYCLKKNEGSSKKLCAVVGYDHRENPAMKLSSLSFAIHTALVFAEAGIDCVLLDGLVLTPLVPFALQELGAALGIMITASHNPKQDAGYKVYASDGCQIRSPMDKEIANAILENLEPWTDYGKIIESRRQGHTYTDPCLGLSSPEKTEELLSAYFEAIQKCGLCTGQAKLGQELTSLNPPSIAYSAMHGVGHKFAVRVFETFGLPPFKTVPQQRDPDPSFPTVPFPNPEEKGALDLAKSFSEENGCDVVLANDPDADRLAVAERDRSSGEWTVFHGDQIGSMLGLWIWEQIGKNCGKPVAMCASTVSSKMLAEIARVEGFYFEDTLTGFKWIGSRAAELNGDGGYRSLFAYEEAIGFCCGDVIFDKDGVSAMAVFSELTYSVYRQGLTLTDHMQTIYDKYGEFVSHNGYYYLEDNAVVDKIMEHIRCNGTYKVDVGPYEIESIRDLGEPGYDSTTADKKPTLPTSKSSPMMTIRFTNSCVAQFRASGTEPKFKYYIEMKGAPGVSRDIVAKELQTMAGIILEKLLQPKENGLTVLSHL